MAQSAENNEKTATFAGGCFWCMEPPFEKIDGVKSVVSGYTGGSLEDPTYAQVSSGASGHIEAIQITYDPAKVTYKQLLDVFWRNIDPTQENGQFADHGSQYRTVIFYQNDQEKKIAQESKKALGDSGKFDKPIATELMVTVEFYPAEEYHQDYYKKNPTHYQTYSYFSGRKPFIKKVWGEEE